MKKQRSIFILFFLFIVFKSSSQDFQLNLLNLDFANNQLVITYSIDNLCVSDKFNIRIEIKRQNGEPIQLKTLTGELGDNIKPVTIPYHQGINGTCFCKIF
jgi:hypothetical protein